MDFGSFFLGVITAALVTVFGWVLSNYTLFKPRLSMSIHGNLPRIEYYSACISVVNNGRIEAKNVLAKVTIDDETGKRVETSKRLHWQQNIPILDDPTSVRIGQFEPISIASGDEELLDFAYNLIDANGNPLNIWSMYAQMQPEDEEYSEGLLHSDRNKSYRVTVTLFADGLSKNVFTFYYKMSKRRFLIVGNDKNSVIEFREE